MPTFTGTDGNDNLTGTTDPDTFNPLLGVDIVDGLGGDDTLIVDYSHAPYDPYAGAGFPGDLISTASSVGASFAGRIAGGGAAVNYSNIEHLQVKLNFWQDRFVLDGAALALGATVVIDGGAGIDTLEANLSMLAGVTLQPGSGGFSASFGTFTNFEAFKLTLGEGADSVTTGAGNDTLIGNGGDDVLNSGGGNDIVKGGLGTNVINAGDGDDTITSSGIDAVDGGSGGFNFDRWSGEYGYLTENFTMVRDSNAGTASLSNGTTLTGIEEVTSITTGSGNDAFTIIADVTSVYAGAGEDSLTIHTNAFSSQLSADGPGAMKGVFGYNHFSGIEHLAVVSGTANDVIAVDAAALLSGATLSIDAASGNDTLAIDLSAFGTLVFQVAPDGALTTNANGTYLNFETFQVTAGAGNDSIVTGGGDDSIYGNSGNDSIDGGSGNDLIDGGAGADAMIGGLGNDVFIVDDLGDSVAEGAGAGDDEIRTGLASYSIAAIANVERLTGTSNGSQALAGNGLANIITGGGGDDSLIGNGGADFLWGKTGDDTYYVDDAAAVVNENDNEGFDTVYTTVSYALNYVSVEVLSVRDRASTYAIDLTGGTRNQTIYGNNGVNALAGGGGLDVLVGLGGNDVYTVDADDQVVEAANGGSDIVIALVNYTLAAGVEVETLRTQDPAVFGNLVLTGNEFGQAILGNAGNNTLNGLGGADWLIGNDGRDTMDGGDGDDWLDGGAGSDTLDGGADNDTLDYRSSTAAVAISLAANTASGGHAAGDVFSNFENVAGSSFADTLTGNSAANMLDGGEGNDFLDLTGGGDDVALGGGGNDAFLFGAAFTSADRVDGGAGANDQIGLQGDYAGANALTLGAGTITGVEVIAVLAGFSYNITTIDANVPAGGVLKIQATQLAAGQSLTFNGSAETDGSFVLFGGQGNDSFTGGAGNDGFYFGPGGFNGGDLIIGGGGANDQLALDGNYAITMGGNVSGVEVLVLLGGPSGQPNSFNIALDEAFVGGGETKTIFGLQVTTTIVFDGSGEHDGLLRIYGGSALDALTGGANSDWIFGAGGGDTMTGGGGRDTFYYDGVYQSTSTGFDRLIGFDDDNGGDLIDLPFAVSGFAAAQTGALNSAAFDSTLQSAFAGLGGHQAAVFTARGGDMDGRSFLVVDADGSGGYQHGVDYVIEFVSPATPIDNAAIFI